METNLRFAVMFGAVAAAFTFALPHFSADAFGTVSGGALNCARSRFAQDCGSNGASDCTNSYKICKGTGTKSSCTNGTGAVAIGCTKTHTTCIPRQHAVMQPNPCCAAQGGTNSTTGGCTSTTTGGCTTTCGCCFNATCAEVGCCCSNPR